MQLLVAAVGAPPTRGPGSFGGQAELRPPLRHPRARTTPRDWVRVRNIHRRTLCRRSDVAQSSGARTSAVRSGTGSISRWPAGAWCPKRLSSLFASLSKPFRCTGSKSRSFRGMRRVDGSSTNWGFAKRASPSDSSRLMACGKTMLAMPSLRKNGRPASPSSVGCGFPNEAQRQRRSVLPGCVMRIGIMDMTVNRGTLSDVRLALLEAAEIGASSFWVPNFFGLDALTTLAVVAADVPGIELGTAVVPILGRTARVLAQQARTVHAALGGRLTLGVGLSHQLLVEGAGESCRPRPPVTSVRISVSSRTCAGGPLSRPIRLRRTSSCRNGLAVAGAGRRGRAQNAGDRPGVNAMASSCGA